MSIQKHCTWLVRCQIVLAFTAFSLCCDSDRGWAADNAKLTELGNAVKDSQDAAELVRELQSNPDTKLLDVLGAMKNQSAIAGNWYLSVAQTIADRNPEQSEAELTQFLPRMSEDPTARYWAFKYITAGKPALREELLESMLADPSLDLRFEAVELGMKRLEDSKDVSSEQKIAAYQELLAAARLPEQIQAIAKQLEEMGAPVDLLRHFGFVSQWKLLGTFDNVGQAGFGVAYAPEVDYQNGQLDFSREYAGKDGAATWQAAETKETDGSLNLNPIFEDEKGAIVYAFAGFPAATDMDCEVRIGSPNACQVWVNGNLVVSREVYHSGNQIDQYVEPVKLRAGANSILVKVCQNEQTESWAQDWLFQLRFTDDTGMAIQPAN